MPRREIPKLAATLDTRVRVSAGVFDEQSFLPIDLKTMLYSRVVLSSPQSAARCQNPVIGPYEVVNVVGEASILRTETGSIGATVTQRTIGELPLQG